MTPELLTSLRCPIDPERAATLTEGDGCLDCNRCHVEFSVRNGLPNLVPAEAKLPDGFKDVQQLSCLRQAARKRHRS